MEIWIALGLLVLVAAVAPRYGVDSRVRGPLPRHPARHPAQADLRVVLRLVRSVLRSLARAAVRPPSAGQGDVGPRN